jgi:hypothetical protein
MSYNTIKFLAFLFTTTNAFLFNNLLNNELIPVVSKLESIVTTKAITSSFYTNLRNEFTLDKIITMVTGFNYHNHANYAYLSIFLTVLYGEYKYMKGANTINEKFKKIDKYDKVYKNVREILYIFIFIFTKDIQHAM